jgi:hypothetical protein
VTRLLRCIHTASMSSLSLRCHVEWAFKLRERSAGVLSEGRQGVRRAPPQGEGPNDSWLRKT